jgi:hypothetical protein
MPALAAALSVDVTRAIDLAEAGEIVRAAATPKSVAMRELRPSRLEALHELAYLRVFTTWESFVEETFIRMICGYVSSIYSPAFQPGKSKTAPLAGAKAALLGTRKFLLWHNPQYLIDRGAEWFDRCPQEQVAASNFPRLEWASAIRHRIAHGTDDTRTLFDAATIGLAGRRYRGASAGRFLRDWDLSSFPRQRWLVTLAKEIEGLASQIAP